MPDAGTGPVLEREAEPSGTRRTWLAGAWREVPVFDRGALRPGDSFRGPALVFESHSATVVAEGWRGRVDGAWNLVLSAGAAIDSP
jgi:N-methylhydantoinase A/oxoprolinase/acetone carboxylase beta subunit